MIELTPNHELMINIIIVLWFLRGLVSFGVGLSGSEKETPSNYGTIDILSGLLYMGVVAVVFIV